MAIYGEPLYSPGADNTDFFLSLLVETLPPPYRPEEYRDFLERFLRPSAEDLSQVNQTFDLLDTFVYPESAPEEWLDWMLLEWWGWRLIPDGYPVARKRRLLSNLHRHYKQRYTVKGIRELLREFGIIAEVTDRRPFVGRYYNTFGVQGFPLEVRVRILAYEPFFSPRNTSVGGYYAGTFVHTTRQIITEEFVRSLVHWERIAGVKICVEWRVASQELLNFDFIADDDEIVV